MPSFAVSRELATIAAVVLALLSIFGVCQAEKSLAECFKQAQEKYGVENLAEKEQIQYYFDCLDVDGSGTIQLSELEAPQNMTSGEYDQGFVMMDGNGDGVIQPGELDSTLSAQSEPSSASPASPASPASSWSSWSLWSSWPGAVGYAAAMALAIGALI
jgi:hypothetical protein